MKTKITPYQVLRDIVKMALRGKLIYVNIHIKVENISN